MTSGRKILALWAVPRSTSTAFEWMMRMRGDMTCFHEPFGEVWYQGESPDWPRLQPDSVRTPGLTYQSAWAALRAAAADGPVFVKDFPLYLDALWSDDFFDCFTHSFIIRDPAKTLASMYRHWPDFHIKETGFAEQRALFDHLASKSCAPPPVIDSDDLLEDPAGMVAAWCQAVGIDFIEEALRWAPGARDEVSWWDGGAFHENLRNSQGLEPQPRTHVDIAAAPPRVQDACKVTRPHYDHLFAHRLRVP